MKVCAPLPAVKNATVQRPRPASADPFPLPAVVAGVLLVVAVAAAYANALGAPFLFDDQPAIVRNATIRTLWPLWGALQPPLEAAGATGRPLVNLSLAVDYALGGLAPRGYHLTNLLLHAAAVLALWGGLRRALRRLTPADPSGGEAVAWGAALLWAVHPLLTESVVCVIQRNEILAGLFLLLAPYAFLRSLDAGARTWAWQAVAVGAALFGMLSKELAVMGPLLVLLLDRTLGAGSFRGAWQERKWFYAALAATWLPLAWLVQAGHQRAGIVGLELGVTPWEYLLTQCRAIPHYLRLVFWPDPLVADYGMAVVRSPVEVWAGLLLLLALVVATLWALVSRPAAGFLGAAFFLILAPSSSVLPLTTQTMAEHRMYLPLATVLVLVVAMLRPIGTRNLAVCAAALALALGLATSRRNQDYRSELELWRLTAAQMPENPRVHASLGTAWVRLGQPAEAVPNYERAVALRPDYADARNDLAAALLQLGRPGEALPHAQAAVRLKPADADIRYNCGNAHAANRQLAEAEEQYRAALRLRPDFTAAHNNLGDVLLRSGRPGEAKDEFAAALRLDPQQAGAHNNLALALVRLGRLADALPHYAETVRLLPDSPVVHHNYALALAAAGRRPEAIAEEEAALRLAPGNAPAREHLVELRGN